MNWVSDVLPLGHPALRKFYQKVSEKKNMNIGIALNADVTRNLKWLLEVIPKAVGVHFIDTMHWDDQEANLVLWTDTSPLQK